MISVVFSVMLYGSITLLALFKVTTLGVNLPHLWLEVKTLQAWVNTAFIAMFALFTYPFSILTILI